MLLRIVEIKIDTKYKIKINGNNHLIKSTIEISLLFIPKTLKKIISHALIFSLGKLYCMYSFSPLDISIDINAEIKK